MPGRKQDPAAIRRALELYRRHGNAAYAARETGYDPKTVLRWVRKPPRLAPKEVVGPGAPAADALEAWAVKHYADATDAWLGALCHGLDDLPDDHLPRDLAAWAASVLDGYATPAEYHELHACPNVKAVDPYQPPPLPDDLVALLAEADAFLEGVPDAQA